MRRLISAVLAVDTPSKRATSPVGIEFGAGRPGVGGGFPEPILQVSEATTFVCPPSVFSTLVVVVQSRNGPQPESKSAAAHTKGNP